MFSKATPEKAIAFTWYCVYVGRLWPLKIDATKRERKLRHVLQFLGTVCVVINFLPLAYSTYLHLIWNDLPTASNAAVSTLSSLHTLAQVGVSWLQHDHLQYLVEDMMTFFRNMKPFEREVYQRYVDKYATFYAACLVWFWVTVGTVPLLTILRSESLPLLTEYPFAVDYEPLRSIIYVEQCYFGAQVGCTLCSNAMAAILLLYAAGKFEILMMDIRSAASYKDLGECLRKYQVVKKFAEDVIYGVQYIVIATLLTSSVTATLCALNLLGSQPLPQKIQYLLLVGSSLLEVYMGALPADVLMEASEDALASIYVAEWYGKDLKMQKTVLQMLIPQKPMVISLRFVMTAMSLKYYSTYCSNAFSLYTTVRVFVEGPETEQSVISANTTCCDN